MLSALRRNLSTILFVGMLGTCGAQIVRTSIAAPVTSPIAANVKKAEREASSRVGGEDTHAPLPPVGALVGGNGVVEPAGRETNIAAQVTSVIERVLVKEGDHVSEGQLLVQLANTVEIAALAAARAELAGEQAALTRTLRGLRVEDKDAVAAETAAAKSRAELSAGVLARTEQLAKTGAATADELERARRAAQTEAATLQATEARLRAASAGSRQEDIAVAKARVAAAEARMAQAQGNVDRLAIRAPYAGEILQVLVREGELYSFQRADPLLRMGDTSTLKVRMDVDERDVARVQLGAAAYVTADAFGDRHFDGKVVEVGRRFGRKNIRTDDPVEKNDTKILEVVLELTDKSTLIPGQRVSSYIAVANGAK